MIPIASLWSGVKIASIVDTLRRIIKYILTMYVRRNALMDIIRGCRLMTGIVLTEKNAMSKAMRKPRPSMPRWWWLYEQCALCKNKSNCNQCKIARSSAKAGESLKRRDQRQILRKDDE